MLDLGVFGAIKYKEREERGTHKLHTVEEQCAELRVLALPLMCSMEESN